MNKLRLLLLVLLFGACQSETTKDSTLRTFLESKFNVTNLESYSKVIVVNDLGYCMDCNNSFAKLVSNYTQNQEYLFLISTAGIVVDISEFIALEQDNILLDPHALFNDFNLVSNCAIIDLEDGDIDTILNVTNENIQQIELDSLAQP